MSKKFIVLFLAILAVLFGDIVATKYWNRTTPELSCKTNDECTIISKYENNSCCAICGADVLNKITAEAREKWRAQNCQSKQCPIYDCYTEKIPRAVCVDGSCNIEWLDRK